MASLASFMKAPSTNGTGKNSGSMHIRYIDYRKLEESPYQYRDLTEESVRHLADLILMDGRVLEPLIVRKKGGDTFEILSGHKRYRACRLLVEEDKEEGFSMIPCCVMDLDNVRAEFAVYSTNGYDQKSSYEITQEISGMKRLLDEHPDVFKRPKGKRTVEMIAEELHLSPSTVKVHQAISNRLGENGMEEYKEGRLNKDAAYELSKLPKEKQDSLLEEGVTTAKEIKKTVKEPKKENSVSEPDTEESEPGIFNFSSLKKKEAEKTEPEEPEFNGTVLNTKKVEIKEEGWTGICPYCNKPLIFRYNTNFCGRCGKKIIWQLEQ